MDRLNRKNFPLPETIPAIEALGRVTAEPLHAKLSSPSFHTAAMDGFAVNAEDTFGAGPDRPLQLQIGQNAWPVNTGRPIPQGTNAVIMIENVNFLTENVLEIEQGVVPWKHVRRVGEDFVASEMIFPGFHLLTPYDLGALIAAGLYKIKVIAKPKVLIIPTGSELVDAEDLSEVSPPDGFISEYNSRILSGIVEQHGGIPIRNEIIKDNFDKLKHVIKKGVESDAHLIVINAGSSAGSEDYTAAVIKDLGEVLVHGVAMMPGKPTILGIIGDKPVIGNPGYPVSATLSFEVFGIPILESMLNQSPSSRPTISAVSA